MLDLNVYKRRRNRKDVLTKVKERERMGKRGRSSEKWGEESFRHHSSNNLYMRVFVGVYTFKSGLISPELQKNEGEKSVIFAKMAHAFFLSAEE